MLVRIAEETMIRLLLEKQSDLCLHCLSKSFWQATSVRKFRASTVIVDQAIGKEGRPLSAFIFINITIC